MEISVLGIFLNFPEVGPTFWTLQEMIFPFTQVCWSSRNVSSVSFISAVYLLFQLLPHQIISHQDTVPLNIPFSNSFQLAFFLHDSTITWIVSPESENAF